VLWYLRRDSDTGQQLAGGGGPFAAG
jgi:hypothetical protein